MTWDWENIAAHSSNRNYTTGLGIRITKIVLMHHIHHGMRLSLLLWKHREKNVVINQM